MSIILQNKQKISTKESGSDKSLLGKPLSNAKYSCDCSSLVKQLDARILRDQIKYARIRLGRYKDRERYFGLTKEEKIARDNVKSWLIQQGVLVK